MRKSNKNRHERDMLVKEAIRLKAEERLPLRSFAIEHGINKFTLLIG